MKKIVQTKHAPAAIGPYSQAVICGNLVFISGQIPLDPLTGLYNPTSPKEETNIALGHIGAILQEVGLTYENIVKVTIFLSNMNDFSEVNEVYGQYFKNNPPSRACVAVKTLPKNCKVEIEAIASKG
ncbi:MAG: RidA family protein [Caldisericia bacterium]|nr:RidA family protein [Caldisericia bacterium]